MGHGKRQSTLKALYQLSDALRSDLIISLQGWVVHSELCEADSWHTNRHLTFTFCLPYGKIDLFISFPWVSCKFGIPTTFLEKGQENVINNCVVPIILMPTLDSKMASQYVTFIIRIFYSI